MSERMEMIVSMNGMINDPLCTIMGDRYKQHEIKTPNVYG